MNLIASTLLSASLVLPVAAQQGSPEVDLSLDDAPSVVRMASASGLRSGTGCDDFNRPNGLVGPDWTDMAGTQEILSNQVHNLGSAGNAWMMYNNATCDYLNTIIEFDLDPNPLGTSRYSAAVFGHDLATGEGLYIKVQNQTGQPGYSNYGFYHGFNGGGYNGWGGFGTIGFQIQGGHVTISITNGGDTANIDIDEDFNGTVDYHFEASGLLASGLVSLLGDTVGYGAWNDGTADNWELNGGCTPSGPTLSVSGLVAGGTATLSVSGATPGRSVWFAYSLAGGGPTSISAGPCGSLTVELSNPIAVLPPVIADPSGNASIMSGVPPGTTGVSVWGQAFDYGSCTLTNALVQVIG